MSADSISSDLRVVLRRLKLSRLLDTLWERPALARQQKTGPDKLGAAWRCSREIFFQLPLGPVGIMPLLQGESGPASGDEPLGRRIVQARSVMPSTAPKREDRRRRE